MQRPHRVHWDAGADEVGTVVESALAANDVDAVIVIHVPPVRTDVSDVAEVLRTVAANASKPVIAVLPHQTGLTGRSSLVSNPGPSGMPGPGSVPVYGEPAAAVAALALAVRHANWLDTAYGEEVEAGGILVDRAEEIIEEALAGPGSAGPLPVAAITDAEDNSDAEMLNLPSVTGTRLLLPEPAADLLACYGLELWPSYPVASEDEALAVAEQIGYPVVLKSTHDTLRHRSELGGIRLNLENERALRTAYLSLVAQHPEEVWEQIVVQAMAPPGVACTVVSREDPAFGPILGFAIGGYLSSLVDDWAFRMLPLTDADAHELVRQPRTAPLLFGYQGADPMNAQAIEAVLLRMARMAEDWPELHRVELNPLLATPSGCYILGASIEVAPASVRHEQQPRHL